MDLTREATNFEIAGSNPATPTKLPYDEPIWERVIQVAQGYRAIYCPSHPNAWPNGYVYAHRLVLEKRLGRLLSDDEIAHHKNEIKSDNHPDNLELSTRSEHSSLHGFAKGVTVVILVCNNCNKKFERVKSKHANKTTAYCSRRCNMIFLRKWQIANGMSNLRKLHREREAAKINVGIV